MYRHDLPVSQDEKRAARRRAFTDADADGRARCHVNLHVSLETQGKEKKCKFSPLQVCDRTSLERWVFLCERVEEMVKRRIQGARWHRFANSSCPHVLFSPFFSMKGHGCYAATVDGRVSGECGDDTLSSSSSFPCFPSTLASVFHDWRIYYAAFFFFLPSSFLSPTTLLLPSQVASRVTAGFAEAHACWQHTVTDLVVERKKLTEPQCKNPVFILETATLQFGPWISPETFLY